MKRLFSLTIAALLLSVGTAQAENNQSATSATREVTREQCEGPPVPTHGIHGPNQTLRRRLPPLSKAATDALGKNSEFSFQTRARTFDPAVDLLTLPADETDPVLNLLSRFIVAIKTGDHDTRSSLWRKKPSKSKPTPTVP